MTFLHLKVAGSILPPLNEKKSKKVFVFLSESVLKISVRKWKVSQYPIK